MPDRTKTDDNDDAWESVSTSHLLHRVQQLASDRFSFLVGEDGVTLRQYVILTAIADTPGASQVELVRATGVDRSTLADLIQRLEKRGLVARKESDADSRANALMLTAEGAETLTNARAHARAADAAIVDALPRTKRRAFRAMLERLAKHADKLARDAERETKRLAKREAKARAKQRKKQKVANDDTPVAAAIEPKRREKRKARRKETVR